MRRGKLSNTFTRRIKRDDYILEAVVTKTREGLTVYLGGGDKPHVGTVVISQPRESLSQDQSMSCTTSVFNLVGHKDDGAARPLAEFLCRELQEVTVVTAGIHLDGASAEQIEDVLVHARKLGGIILRALRRNLLLE